MGIGERVRKRRVELGLTRNELAEKSHVTPSAVANYENNISVPKPELLISLMKNLGTDANYLYADYISDDLIEKNYKKNMSEEEQASVRKYRELTENGKRLVRIVINEEYERMMSQRWIMLECYFPGSRKRNAGFLLQEYAGKIRAREKNIPEGTDYCFQIQIDRYEPVFQKQDILAVSSAAAAHNEIGIFCFRGVCYIRTLYRKGSVCKLRALNVMEPDIVVEKEEELCCLGKILGKAYGEYEILHPEKE